jgi:hypothetical protein
MKRYNTFIKVNRPIRFWGLSPLQFTIIALLGAIIVFILIFKQIHPVLLISMIAAMIYIFVLLFTRLKQHHKKGNPNYLQGLSIKASTPKRITDTGKVFKNLIRK